MNFNLTGDVLPAWLGARDAAVSALGGGTNNDSYAVECAGERYLLRVYRPDYDPDRVRYEHALLGLLNAAKRSFKVPAPLTARFGDTLVAAPDGRWAALFPFLPGIHADSEDPDQLQVCGAALAELDVALAPIDLPAPATGLLAMSAFPAVHPAAPDPDAVVAGLPLSHEERRCLASILHSLADTAPRLAAQLPVQAVHRDFDASNVLLVAGRVSAVLDFEFARPDIRALDFAASLAAFGGAGWDPAQGGGRLAFARGYLARLSLTEAEIAAVPDLMLLARASSLLHRAARQRLGTASQTVVLARAQALLRRAAWLERHASALVDQLLVHVGSPGR
jgi:homoserine kinase type II